MGHRSLARFLAPLALIAAVAGVVVVVQSARPNSSDSDRTTSTVATQQHHRARRHARKRTYVVRSGDNLTVIAERTGVPLETIERLNPGLDAQTLRVGQRLRLSR